VLSDEQRATFKEAAMPLVKWLNENMCPHDEVCVTTIGAELLSGEHFVPIKDFIKG
jgi:hypothetical protein